MNVLSRTTFVVNLSLLCFAQLTPAQDSPAGHSTRSALSSPAASDRANAPPVPAASVPAVRSAARVTDVALESDGVIRGRVLHADGTPIDGARVLLRQENETVAAVFSTNEGDFAVQGLPAGVYQIEAPTGAGTYRFWAKDAAPPAAKTQALLVAKTPVVRGQFGYLSPAETLAIGLGAAGVTLGAIAVTDLNDQENQLSRIERRVNWIPASP